MKQRILSALLALAMLLTLVPTVAFAATSTPAGNGTKDSPYIISNEDDWETVLSNARPAYYLNGKFIKLDADIDLSGRTWSVNSL